MNNSKRRELSDEELIQSILTFFNRNGRPPSTRDIKKTSYLYHLNTYKKRLKCKNWGDVLELAGLSRIRRDPPRGIWFPSTDDLIKSLFDFHEKHKRFPNTKEFGKDELYHYAVYRKSFDSFSIPRLNRLDLISIKSIKNILFTTDMIRDRKKKWKTGRKETISDSELIESLVYFYNKHNRLPRCMDADKSDILYAHSTYHRRFGTTKWEEVLKYANLIDKYNNEK